MHWKYILFICFACFWFIQVLYLGQRGQGTARFVQESPIYRFNFMKGCRPSSMQASFQYKTNSSSCEVCPLPTDSAAWNIREQNKNIFVQQQALRDTQGSGVLPCSCARVFPHESDNDSQDELSFSLLLGWTGSSGGGWDPLADRPVPQQLFFCI